MNLFTKKDEIEIWEAKTSNERLVRVIKTEKSGEEVHVQSCEPSGELIEDGLIVPLVSSIFLELYRLYTPDSRQN
ncbi:hypothetical protein ACFL1Y_01440 [Patescibacteria group bacterium]